MLFVLPIKSTEIAIPPAFPKKMQLCCFGLSGAIITASTSRLSVVFLTWQFQNGLESDFVSLALVLLNGSEVSFGRRSDVEQLRFAARGKSQLLQVLAAHVSCVMAWLVHMTGRRFLQQRRHTLSKLLQNLQNYQKRNMQRTNWLLEVVSKRWSWVDVRNGIANVSRRFRTP